MRLLAAAAACLAIQSGQVIAPRAEVTLRFHHLHYGVGDPAAAIKRVAAATGGTRLLVPGLGAGVRVGTEYVLFERAVEAQSAAAPGGAAAVEAAYRQATAWLARRGVLVIENAAGGPKLAASVGDERLDHVGFAADDLEGAMRAVEAAGAAPLRRSADAALFKIPDGLRIEIVRNAEGVDAFWCPMHPDVRAAAPGRCPVCAMEMVPIAVPRAGEYKMDVTLTASAGGAGAAGLRVGFREPDTGARVASFVTVHERLLHLFIVGRDLEFFRHAHPEPRPDGSFELAEPLPAGEYMLIADLLPAGGTPQMLQRAVATPGYRGPLFQEPPPLEGAPGTSVVDGVRVRLDARGLAPGREAVLRVSFQDAASGAPVTDLEPFLGAPAHLLIVNRELTQVIHAHPEVDLPPVTFEPLMPAAGTYKMWVQFQRHGRVSTSSFVVTVG